MVLYNMVAWPYIFEKMNNSLPIDKMISESDRAKAIVQQVDLVCDYTSGIMTMIKNLSLGTATNKIK